jgi:hypothetical protein
MLEEETSGSQKHDVGVPCCCAIKKRISSVEWCAEGRVVGREKCEAFCIDIWGQGTVVDNEMTDELFERIVLRRTNQAEVTDCP